MLKKILSYTIIFSILHSNFSYCMEDPELGDKSKVSPKRVTTENASLVKTSSSNLTYGSFSSSTSSTPSPRSEDSSDGSPSKDKEKLRLLQTKQELHSSENDISSDEREDFIPIHIKDHNTFSVAEHKNPEDSESKNFVSENSQRKSHVEKEGIETNNPAGDFHRNNSSSTSSEEDQHLTGDPALIPLDSDTDGEITNTELERAQTSIPQATSVQGAQPNSTPLHTRSHLNEPSAEDSDDFFLLSIQDPVEKKKFSLKIASKVLSIFQTLKPDEKRVLQKTTVQYIQGKISKKQWFTIAGGILVGVGTAVAMAPLYDGGLFYLADAYGKKIFYDFEGSETLRTLITFLTAFDAIPRNAILWKKAVTYFTEQSVDKSRIALTLLASFLPSLLEPSFLATSELYMMHESEISGLDNEFAIWMFTLCPILLADAWAFNYDLVWESWDEFLGPNLRSPSLWSKAPLRYKYSKALDKLSGYVFRMHEDDPYIEDLYSTISSLKTDLQAECPEIEDENVEAAQSFFLIRHLLSLEDKLKNTQELVKSWYETITEKLTYGILISGSFVRFLALRLAIETFFELILSEDITRVCGLGGSTLGFPLLTMFEYKGLKNFFTDFLWHKNPHAHGSHPYFRGAEKTLSAAVGLLFVMPLLVLSVQASDRWFEGQLWVKLLSIPYLFAEFTAQTTSFNDSYNKKIGTGITTVYNDKIRKEGPMNTHKKDVVLEMIENMKKRISTLPTSVLEVLEQSLGMKEEAPSTDISGEFSEV